MAWALENGVTNGLADGTFGVNSTCTRGQSVTFLYRAMGTAPTTVNGFTDVAAGDFYAEAVAWAVENGVTSGTSASAFSPKSLRSSIGPIRASKGNTDKSERTSGSPAGSSGICKEKGIIFCAAGIKEESVRPRK